MAAKHPSIGNLDVARGPQNTVELRVRHVAHLDPSSLRFPPTLVLLADSEVQTLIARLQAVLKEPSPAKRPSAPPPEDHSDLA